MSVSASTEHDAAATAGNLTLRELVSWEEFNQATALYEEVFGYSREQGGLNPRLLSGLIRHGGSVVGAISEQGQVLAFAYGWTSVDIFASTRSLYHYSQAAVVSSTLQGQGVGRRLKEVQSVIASRYGADRMRWTFDPLLARNAHFNFDVLGATGRWFHRDAMGPGADRITVEWVFAENSEAAEGAEQALVHDAAATAADAARGTPTAAPAQADLPQLDIGDIHQEFINDTEYRYLAIPAQPTPDGPALGGQTPAQGQLAQPQQAQTAPDQAQPAALRSSIAELIEAGFIAVSCRRRDTDTAVYTFRKA